jgi:hypothetical protein
VAAAALLEGPCGLVWRRLPVVGSVLGTQGCRGPAEKAPLWREEEQEVVEVFVMTIWVYATRAAAEAAAKPGLASSALLSMEAAVAAVTTAAPSPPPVVTRYCSRAGWIPFLISCSCSF